MKRRLVAIFKLNCGPFRSLTERTREREREHANRSPLGGTSPTKGSGFNWIRLSINLCPNACLETIENQLGMDEDLMGEGGGGWIGLE